MRLVIPLFPKLFPVIPVIDRSFDGPELNPRIYSREAYREVYNSRKAYREVYLILRREGGLCA